MWIKKIDSEPSIKTIHDGPPFAYLHCVLPIFIASRGSVAPAWMRMACIRKHYNFSRMVKRSGVISG
jgi:hypothetical protein